MNERPLRWLDAFDLEDRLQLLNELLSILLNRGEPDRWPCSGEKNGLMMEDETALAPEDNSLDKEIVLNR